MKVILILHIIIISIATMLAFGGVIAKETAGIVLVGSTALVLVRLVSILLLSDLRDKESPKEETTPNQNEDAILVNSPRNVFEEFAKIFKPTTELGRNLRDDIAKIGKEKADTELMDDVNEILNQEK